MNGEPKLNRGRSKQKVDRREILRRFGLCATCTAPAMTVLLSSRSGRAGSFFKSGGDGGDGSHGRFS